MGNSKHRVVEYSSDYNHNDPVTKLPFVDGEKLILCDITHTLISLRSLQANGYDCPLCRNILNENLTIAGPSRESSSNQKKPRETYSPNSAPTRRNSNVTAVWGGLILFTLLCLIIGGVAIFSGIINSGGTANPVPTNTSVRSTSTTVILPSPRPTSTPRPIFIAPPKPTSRPVVSCSGVVVNLLVTDRGNVLHIKQCSSPPEYDMPPMANGSYTLAPNEKFLVYAGVDGFLYIAKIGSNGWVILENLKRTGDFGVFAKDQTPDFSFQFTGNGNSDSPYWLTLYERAFSGQRTMQIPLKYSK